MRTRTVGTGAAMLAAAVALGGVAPGAQAGPRTVPEDPVAYGTGGAVATQTGDATAAAIKVLREGGNAVDGAVAAAAALGVTDPFVAGPGGGGFFVYRRASDGKVFTIDGREKAPAGAKADMFLDAAGEEMDFDVAVESGLSVGVPGNVATWGRAVQRWGRNSFAKDLAPAQRIATRGFKIDRSFGGAISGQTEKLSRFAASAELFLPGGTPRGRGQTFRNPDLARTYRQLRKNGWRWFYTGPIAQEIAKTVQDPPEATGQAAVAGGSMTADDLKNYTARFRAPVSWQYRGYTLFGMAPPSSGGTTIGEAMNILETGDVGGDTVNGLYRYIEALKLAFADRGEWVGDPDFVPVPTTGLLSDAFAQQRAGLIGATALPTPVDPGDPRPFNGGSVSAFRTDTSDHEKHTNHLVVADRAGNVVSYTNTIEQVAGSGITVPDRGFLLNNELTDFNFLTGTANSVAPNKRPRSSMSPTIITRGKKVVEAIGAPGGSTIITSVLQTIINQIDFGMSLPEAIEAPRASSRNGKTVGAEPAFIDLYGEALTARGETFESCCEGSVGEPFYIARVSGLSFLSRGRMIAATESWRGGGGSAMVVNPRNAIPRSVAKASALPAR